MEIHLKATHISVARSQAAHGPWDRIMSVSRSWRTSPVDSTAESQEGAIHGAEQGVTQKLHEATRRVICL